MEGDLIIHATLSGTLSPVETITGRLSPTGSLEGELTLPRIIETETYQGAHEVTPSDETQILMTEGKALNENIVINPIPSNYGRITWDGRVITVS